MKIVRFRHDGREHYGDWRRRRECPVRNSSDFLAVDARRVARNAEKMGYSRLRGIRGAGFIYGGVPAGGYGDDDGVEVVEHPALPADQRPYAIHRWVDPGYFSAIGIPIQRGRTFDWNQQLDHATEIIVSESFARLYFPGEDPLGKHLSLSGDRPREIVAIAGDTRFAPGESAKPVMYSQLLTDPDRDTHGAAAGRR